MNLEETVATRLSELRLEYLVQCEQILCEVSNQVQGVELRFAFSLRSDHDLRHKVVAVTTRLFLARLRQERALAGTFVVFRRAIEDELTTAIPLSERLPLQTDASRVIRLSSRRG